MNRPFTFGEVLQPKEKLTISKELTDRVRVFRLGAGTSISEESYEATILYLGLFGRSEITGAQSRSMAILEEGGGYILPPSMLAGMRTAKGSSYLEIIMEEDLMKNEERVFKLKDLVEYEDDSIVNFDIVDQEGAKLVVMALDRGTSLSPHKAPCEAYVTILEGEGTVIYENEPFAMKAGEVIHFDRDGLHAVEATSRMKIALLLLRK